MKKLIAFAGAATAVLAIAACAAVKQPAPAPQATPRWFYAQATNVGAHNTVTVDVTCRNDEGQSTSFAFTLTPYFPTYSATGSTFANLNLGTFGEDNTNVGSDFPPLYETDTCTYTPRTPATVQTSEGWDAPRTNSPTCTFTHSQFFDSGYDIYQCDAWIDAG